MVQILDVMEKALEGKPMSETDYQLRLFAPKVAEKVKEHGIKWDPQNPILSDDKMADELFEAGLELLVDVGAYCTDTGRVISYTEEEIRPPSSISARDATGRTSLRGSRRIRRLHGVFLARAEAHAQATGLS
jgi:hypothetical protein